MGLVLRAMVCAGGMVAHRRNRPYRMGSLLWQLNDSWPVVSGRLSIITGNWKAMQYQTRRAFAPCWWMPSARAISCALCCPIACRRRKTLHLVEWTFNGKVIRRHQVEGMLPVNASGGVFWRRLAEGIRGLWHYGFVIHDAQGCGFERRYFPDEVYSSGVSQGATFTAKAEISRKVQLRGVELTLNPCAGSWRVCGRHLAKGAFLRQFLRPAAWRT